MLSFQGSKVYTWLKGGLLLGFTGLYRVLPGFTGFYRVLPGFTGFCRVLPSCTESHWVCSDRYRIKRFGWSRLWTIWRSWRDEWRRRNRQSANCAPLIDALMDGRGGRPIRGRDRGLAWRHGAADGAGDASELRFFFPSSTNSKITTLLRDRNGNDSLAARAARRGARQRRPISGEKTSASRDARQQLARVNCVANEFW